MTMHLNERETATILFALRYLQSNLEDLLGDIEPNETLSAHFIDSNGDALADPTEEFIDALCEKVNAPEDSTSYYEFKIEKDGELHTVSWFDYHFLTEKDALIAKDDWAPDDDWTLVKVKVTTEIISH